MSRLMLVAFLLVAFSLSLAAPPAAGPKKEILDLVPQAAFAAFGIRSVNDLSKKGDAFLKKAKLKREVRFSNIVAFVYGWLGIESGIDEDAPVVLVLPGGVKENFDSLVLAVPFKGLNEMAKNFGFEKGKLKPGKTTAVEGRRNFTKHVHALGGHFFLSGHAAGIDAVVKKKPIGGELSAAQRKAIDGSDLVLVIG